VRRWFGQVESGTAPPSALLFRIMTLCSRSGPPRRRSARDRHHRAQVLEHDHDARRARASFAPLTAWPAGPSGAAASTESRWLPTPYTGEEAGDREPARPALAAPPHCSSSWAKKGTPATSARTGRSPGDSRSARVAGVAQPASSASASAAASFGFRPS
jgi:hypothetical protein